MMLNSIRKKNFREIWQKNYKFCWSIYKFCWTDFHESIGVYTIVPELFHVVFSTSGRNLKTESWLFCHETDYILISNFTVSHQKVISSRLGFFSIEVKPEILVKTGSFRKFEFMTSHTLGVHLSYFLRPYITRNH